MSPRPAPVSDDSVLALLCALFDVGEHNLTEVDKVRRGYFYERDGMEAVSNEEHRARTRDGLVTVLNLRPNDEFAMEHQPRTVKIPLYELESSLNFAIPAAIPDPSRPKGTS